VEFSGGVSVTHRLELEINSNKRSNILAKHLPRGPQLVERPPTVLIVGAESLLGKELRDQLQSKSVPVTVKLISVEEEGGILTEQEGEPIVMGPLGWHDLNGGTAVLLAGSPESSAEALKRAQQLAPQPLIIDVTGALDSKSGTALRAPLIESGPPRKAAVQVIAHPAAIALTMFFKQLLSAGAIVRSVVQVFEPASERGQPGLNELQQQTVGLLAFQKLKKEVYDAQASFNMLPQYGSEAPKTLAEIELRIDRNLATLLAVEPVVPMPSLRLIQAPVFHGYSFSIWVEFDRNPGLEAISNALTAPFIELRRSDEEPPSNVGAAGQSGITVGSIVIDRNHPSACWFWVVADNLRIAADNAIEVVSESL
jgi:aspartate-semialdehyde dehydrogenase